MWNAPVHPVRNVELLTVLAWNALNKMSTCTLKRELMRRLEARDVESLAFFEFPAYETSALSVLDALYARQVIAFFSKNASLDFGRDCEAVARETWIRTETVCRETNARFATLSRSAGTRKGTTVDVDSVLYAAQQKIAKVLGPRVPRLSELSLVFGPGATTSVKKKNACARTKLSARPSCSTNVVPILTEFWNAWPAYADLHSTTVDEGDEDFVWRNTTVEIADGVVAFVPKNAKTHRTVLVEPTINGVIQGGYGKYISRRLLRVGIDLSDQARNKRLARIGSLTGELATLDLSSASDLISKGLVAHLLPLDWYCALSACRTPVAVLDGERLELEKFSSMGNGFTFPLQSLIFWALVTACQDSFESALKVSVYGDDIICPTGSVPAVLEVFQYCGFEINKLKSYWEGPFRESCGGDYYLGVNIRPLYIKDSLSLKTLFILHNYYVRNGLDDLANEVLRQIPDKDRLWGPDGYGDGHLLGDWSRSAHRRDQGWSGFLFETYKEVGEKHKKLLPGDFILPAYTTYVAQPEDWLAFAYNFVVIPSERLSPLVYGIGHRECCAPLPKGGKHGDIPYLALPGVVSYKKVKLYTLAP